MEPLSPNDPLWKLLGQAKPVKPRPNFAQNVVREARQTPQDRGLLQRLRGWFEHGEAATSRIAWAGASAVAALALLTALPLLREKAPVQVTQAAAPKAVTPAVAVVDAAAAVEVEVDFPLVPESDALWANMEQFDALLAVEDTSELTDGEIRFLLY